MSEIVVIGDALLDVDVDGRAERLCPDAPVPVLDVTGRRARPGGAALAAALLAAEGHAVTLVAALDNDQAGARLREELDDLRLVEGPGRGETAVKTRLRADGRTLLRVDSGEGRPGKAFGAVLTRRIDAALVGAAAVLVADYGRGVAADPVVRAAVARAAQRKVPVVWDPHPRGPVPVPGTTVATPNAGEAATVAELAKPADPHAAVGVGRALLRRWECGAAAVTLGDQGAVLVCRDGTYHCATPPAVAGGDACGAGDAFAGRVTLNLADGQPLPAALADAVDAAAAFVAAGGASGFAARRVSGGGAGTGAA